MDEITVSSGVTESERYLAALCKRTFLRLWSYPNVFYKCGKELCDVLVIFRNNVIIFSDKDIGFKNTGNINVDWGRWVKKAVFDSAKQVYGAEKWICGHPDRLFLDAKCSKKVPVELPSASEMRIHRIIVARNAVQRLRDYTGSYKPLIIAPDIVGQQHLKHPFHIGRISDHKGFVHILDDISLNVVLSEFDTISDLVDYLSKKERLITLGRLEMAASEAELVALYYETIENNESQMSNLPGTGRYLVPEGHYHDLISLPQYKRGKELDHTYKHWDRLIEHFSSFILQDELHYSNANSFDEAIMGLREMASEPRVVRRMLSKAIEEKNKNLIPNQMNARSIISPFGQDRGYVFLVVPRPSYISSYEEYREYRRGLLISYCRGLKSRHRCINVFVGIATDPPGNGSSEDLVYMEARGWTESDYQEAEKHAVRLNILREENLKLQHEYEDQFPLEVSTKELNKIRKRSKRRFR